MKNYKQTNKMIILKNLSNQLGNIGYYINCLKILGVGN